MSNIQSLKSELITMKFVIDKAEEARKEFVRLAKIAQEAEDKILEKYADIVNMPSTTTGETCEFLRENFSVYSRNILRDFNRSNQVS